MINPYRVGKTVLFQVTYDRDWHLFESVPFFFISVFGVNDINFRIRLLIWYAAKSDRKAMLTMLNIIRAMKIGCLRSIVLAVPHELLSFQIKDMDRSSPCAGGPYCDPPDLCHPVAQPLDQSQPAAAPHQPLQ